MMKNKGLLIALAAALLLRLGFVLAFPIKGVQDDAAGYDALAWNLVSGKGFQLETAGGQPSNRFTVEIPGPTPSRGPGFPAFLAAVYLLFGHSLLMATVAQAFTGMLCCLLAFYIADRLFGPRKALAAAWFMALFPVPVIYTGMLMSETFFTLPFLASVALFVKSDGGERTGVLFLSGLVLGLTTLTRPTTILFPLAVLLALLVSGKGRAIVKTAVFTLAFALTIAPWTIRNYRLFHTFLPVATGASTCAYATGIEAEGGTYSQGFEEFAVKWAAFKASPDFGLGLDPRIKFDRQLKQEASEKIKAHRAAYIGVVLRRTPKYWLSSYSSLFGVDRPLGEYRAEGRWWPIAARGALSLFHASVFLLALLGMYFERASFRRWAILPLALLYFNMHTLFDMCPRYLVPIFPYLLILSAAGAVRLKDRFTGRTE